MMQSHEGEQAIYKLLKNLNTAMLVTHGRSGSMHGRPMVVAQVDEMGDLWFVTGLNTPKIEEIRANEQVQISFQDQNKHFLSVTGRANLLRDEAKIAELWRDSFSPWFPQGQNDPNLVLLHVQVQHWEYWDETGFSQTAEAFALPSYRY